MLTWNTRSTARHIAAAQEVEDTLRKPIGLWLAQNTLPDSRVLTESIGYIGYFSGRPVLDMVGLVSPEVVAVYREHRPRPVGEIVVRFKPEILVLRGVEREEIEGYSRETGTPLMDREYIFARRFPKPVGEPALTVYRRQDVGLIP